MEERETQEGKRKRIATACRTCQKKKIRCDGKMPCSHCMTHDIECVFTQMPQKRGSRGGAKYTEALEERLRRMESLLDGSGLSMDKAMNQTAPPPTQDTITIANHVETLTPTAVPTAMAPSPASLNHELPALEDTTTQQSFNTSPDMNERARMMDHDMNRDDASSSRSKETETLPYPIDPLGTNGLSEAPGIGPSAAFSIFSPKGIQWVIEKTGNPTFKDAIFAAARDEGTMEYWRSDTFSDVFARRVFRQLPQKAETISIVSKFFKDFNSTCPLFSEPVFMALVERQYSSDPYDSAGWWASLNVVIAITLKLQALNNAPPAVTERSRDYLRNCLAVLTELTMQSTDLFGVQALLGMALLMQGTPDPRPTAFLIATALRLSHSLGLHKKDSGFNVDPLEAEQRKRVFWIAYRLDKDLCIRSGLPLIQDDDDMNLDLPSKDPEDQLGNIPLPDGSGKVNLFRIMAEFATIEARVHKQLYSTKAAERSDEELLVTISELDHQLEEWKESIPIMFQPEYEIKAPHTPQSLHIIVLHFEYYNCLHTIHRTSTQHSYWKSKSKLALQGFDYSPLNPGVFQSAALCTSAARASIRLIRYIPVHDIGFVWRVLYYPVSTFVTLFANILQTPTDSRARSDLRLMGSFNEFLASLQHDDSQEVKRIFRVCSEFERIARDVVDRQEKNKDHHRKWSMNLDADKQQSANRSAVPLTPVSATVSNGMEYNSPPMYGRTASQASYLFPILVNIKLIRSQNFPSTLNDCGLGPDQFSQHFPGLMGSALNPYAEVQPMFPNGLAMPWNGTTFHGTYAPDNFASGAYNFEAGMNG